MISEHDLEQLETLLDGELAEEQSAALRQRLSAEPALAQALKTLRDQRDLRQQAWRAMEPQEATVAALESAIHVAIVRDDVWSRRLRALRYVSGLAACIMLGFLIGRFVPYGPMNQSDRSTGVLIEPGGGAIMEVSDDRSTPSPRGGGFRVILTDAYGRVIAEQPFPTLDEAREFTDDLRRLQTQPYGAVRPMRVSDTIYTKGQF